MALRAKGPIMVRGVPWHINYLVDPGLNVAVLFHQEFDSTLKAGKEKPFFKRAERVMNTLGYGHGKPIECRWSTAYERLSQPKAQRQAAGHDGPKLVSGLAHFGIQFEKKLKSKKLVDREFERISSSFS